MSECVGLFLQVGVYSQCHQFCGSGGRSSRWVFGAEGSHVLFGVMVCPSLTAADGRGMWCVSKRDKSVNVL